MRLPVDHLRSEVLPGANVGRVGHQQVEAAAQVVGQGVEPGTGRQRHPAGRAAEAGQVGPGHGEGVFGAVGAPDAGGGPLGGDGQADGPGTGAEVGDRDVARPADGQAVELVEGVADDGLGLGPRDQPPPVDQQVEGAERPVAQHVLERLAVQPAPQQVVVAGHGPHRGELVQVAVAGGIQPAGLLHDPARLGDGQAGCVDAGGGLGQHLPPGDRAVRPVAGVSHRPVGGCARRRAARR